MSIDRFDVLIVGAGPAGSAAALSALSARPGARVGIVDRAMFPRDKVCGDGLTPAAVSALKRLGVADILTSQTPVRLWRVTGPTGHHFTAPLVPPAYVLPRRVLDAHLVAAAISRGAEFIHARVTNIERQGEHTVINGRWFARCLVGADGANSVVRARLGVSRHPARHTGVALRGYAAVASGRGLLDVRFVPGRLWPAYAWLFTAGDGSANVGVGTFGSTTRTDRRELSGILTELFPHADLDGDSVAGHRLPLSSGGAKLTAGPALLAGDAAGLVDPLTGEGVHTALLSGLLAGRASVIEPETAPAAYRDMIDALLGRRLRHLRIARGPGRASAPDGGGPGRCCRTPPAVGQVGDRSGAGRGHHAGMAASRPGSPSAPGAGAHPPRLK